MRTRLAAFLIGVALAMGGPLAEAHSMPQNTHAAPLDHDPQLAPAAPAAQLAQAAPGAPPAPAAAPAPPTPEAPAATPTPPASAASPTIRRQHRIIVVPNPVIVPPGTPMPTPPAQIGPPPGTQLGPGQPGTPLPPRAPRPPHAAPLPPGTPTPGATPRAAEGRTYTPGPFHSIEISGSADVRFTQGPTDLVIVRGDEEVQRAIVLEVDHGRLRIDQGGAWRFWDPHRVRIEVQSRELARVSISGAGDFIAPNPVRADRLTVSISGAGSVRFARLDAQKVMFGIAGKGDGQVAGTTKELVVRIAGHGEFRGEHLKADLCEVQVSGVGHARIWSVEQLRLAVAGVGKIDYWGTPQVERRISGAATINERGAK